MKGGLYFTVVIRPDIPLIMSSRVNFMASVVLVKTLRDMFGIEAMVKWPNDILVGGRKTIGDAFRNGGRRGSGFIYKYWLRH